MPFKSQVARNLSSGRVLWAENLRAVAICSVIVLHVAAPAVEHFGRIDLWNWWVANFFDAITRFCVPVFLMLSGAFLIKKENNWQEYFRRRFQRVVIPFLFWSFMYSSFWLFINVYQGGSLSWTTAFFRILKDLWEGASYHFWFIYLILGLYLLVPFLSWLVCRISLQRLQFIILIWLFTLLTSFIPLKIYEPNSHSAFLLAFNFFGYLGYPLLGFFLINPKAVHFEKKGLIFTLLLLGFSFTFFGTGLFTNKNDLFYELFYGFLSPNIVLFSTGVFLLFKRFNQPHPLLLSISQHSYGIYLVHVLILIILDDIFPAPNFPLLISIPLISLVCLLLSWGIILFFQKLPILRKVSG